MTVGVVALERVGDAEVVGVVAAARGADVVGGAGVEAPTGRQIEPPGTSTVSTDASFTASRSAQVDVGGVGDPDPVVTRSEFVVVPAGRRGDGRCGGGNILLEGGHHRFARCIFTGVRSGCGRGRHGRDGGGPSVGLSVRLDRHGRRRYSERQIGDGSGAGGRRGRARIVVGAGGEPHHHRRGEREHHRESAETGQERIDARAALRRLGFERPVVVMFVGRIPVGSNRRPSSRRARVVVVSRRAGGRRWMGRRRSPGRVPVRLRNWRRNPHRAAHPTSARSWLPPRREVRGTAIGGGPVGLFTPELVLGCRSGVGVVSVDRHGCQVVRTR